MLTGHNGLHRIDAPRTAITEYLQLWATIQAALITFSLKIESMQVVTNVASREMR
jgi:hypothetical protein